MKKVLFAVFVILVSFNACRKEVVSTTEYEKSILSDAFMKNIPYFQSENENSLLKKQQIKTISYVALFKDSLKPDSIAFVELDKEGRMIRRTTKDNIGLGCLPYMVRQEFEYEADKLKKVSTYTFKYKPNYVLENWLLRDTSQLVLVDWFDYSYQQDTIFMKAGYADFRFIKDGKGDIIQQSSKATSNQQVHKISYKHSGNAIECEISDSHYPDIMKTNLQVAGNEVTESYKGGRSCKFIYDDNGLLSSESIFDGEKLIYKMQVSYTFY